MPVQVPFIDAAGVAAALPLGQCIRAMRDVLCALDRGAVVQPVRSVIRLPYQNVTDLGLFKNFDAGGRIGLQFRAEMFNVFNRTNFTNANTTLGNPAFGRLTTALEPRLIQFGLRATF